MYPTRTVAQEVAEDIYFGQAVMVQARWFFAAALGLLGLFYAASLGAVIFIALLTILLLLINFFIYTRQLLHKHANEWLLLLLAGCEALMVMALILFWPNKVGVLEPIGFDSPFYVLFYPLLFVFALVFPPRRTAIYTAIVVGGYLLMCVVSNFGLLLDAAFVKDLVARGMTLAAMSALGTFYWRIQRERRRTAVATPTRS